MDFRYLKAFLASAEHGSFSKAAEELNIAQSAVSRQVKLLEESINDELLIRSSKHLTLTAKGKRLFDAVKNFQSAALTLLANDERSLLRIGIPHGLLETWFQKLLGSYYEREDHNFKISIEDLPDLRNGLDGGRFELIFTPYEIDSELIVSRPVLQESFVLVSAKVLDLEQLQDQRWIIYAQGDHLLKLSRRHSHRMIQVNSVTAILKLVRQGVGIAVLPDHMVTADETLYCYRDEKLPTQTIFASHLRYRQIPAALAGLLAILPKI
ncbi:MAG: LysR family transcriptional regulator [Proteobacteria bacterium]|nr:LysR family transcriptional regulator [Pseudomonadota bacterium]